MKISKVLAYFCDVREETCDITSTYQSITVITEVIKLTYKYNCRKISFTQKQGCHGDEEKSQKKTQEQQTLNGMADGVNITVEAHWCLLPK